MSVRIFRISRIALFCFAASVGAASSQSIETEQDGFLLELGESRKAGKYGDVLKQVEVFERREEELAAPVLFFEGEARYHTCRPKNAAAALSLYVEKAGKNARYYREALDLLLKIDEREASDHCQMLAKAVLQKAKDYLTAKRFTFGFYFETEKGGQDRYTFKTRTYINPGFEAEKKTSCYIQFKQAWQEKFASLQSTVQKGREITIQFWNVKNASPKLEYGGVTEDRRFYKYHVINDYQWRNGRIQPIYVGTLYSRFSNSKINLPEINDYFVTLRNACHQA
ncbi:MAG: hypothetical protein ABJN40_13545 [Sneathiella sp.]